MQFLSNLFSTRKSRFLEGCSQGDLEKVKNNFDSSLIKDVWEEGLFRAIRKEKVEVVRYLVSLDKKVDPWSYSPVVHAVDIGNLEIIKILVEDGNLVFSMAVEIAIKENKQDLVVFLVESRIKAGTEKSEHIKYFAEQAKNQPEILSYLLKVLESLETLEKEKRIKDEKEADRKALMRVLEREGKEGEFESMCEKLNLN